MSQENVEVVRRAVEAYGREGRDGVLRYYDPPCLKPVIAAVR